MSASPSVGSALTAGQPGGSHRMQTQLHWMTTLASHQDSHNLFSEEHNFG